MAHSKPFYAGWDEQLRKLVITTRYLPRYLSTHGMRIPDEEVCREDVKEYLPLARRLSPPLAQLKHKETNGGSESLIIPSSLPVEKYCLLPGRSLRRRRSWPPSLHSACFNGSISPRPLFARWRR
jgi:hypothetical protein